MQSSLRVQIGILKEKDHEQLEKKGVINLKKSKITLIAIICLLIIASIFGFVFGYKKDSTILLMVASALVSSSLTLLITLITNFATILFQEEREIRQKNDELKSQLQLQLKNIIDYWNLVEKDKNIHFHKQFKLFSYYIRNNKNVFEMILREKVFREYEMLYDLLWNLEGTYFFGMGWLHNNAFISKIKEVINVSKRILSKL
ncbi:MAG: hypothetical protein ACTSRR_09320 [Candidatus Heimdallarchaeaceae archaeon]